MIRSRSRGAGSPRARMISLVDSSSIGSRTKPQVTFAPPLMLSRAARHRRHEDHGPIGLQGRDFHSPHASKLFFGSHPHHVPNLPLLPLWDNAVRVAHLTAEEVLQLGVAVKSRAVLSDLENPWPYSRCPRERVQMPQVLW